MSKLPVVVGDITGVTGQRIVRALVAGPRDPQVLAAYRDPRCHASKAEIIAALTGQSRPEHPASSQQNLAPTGRLSPAARPLRTAIEAAGPGAVATAGPRPRPRWPRAVAPQAPRQRADGLRVARPSIN